MVLSFSIVNPILAVELQRRGLSATAIGVFAMLPFVTIAAMLPLLPRLFARFGVARSYQGGLLLEGLCMAGYAFGDGYALWCACSVLGSIGAAAVWNGTEAMIAFNAPAHARGRATGLYQTALGAALAVGPFVPGVWALLAPQAGPMLLVRLAPLLFLAAAVLASTRVLERLPVAHRDARERSLWSAMAARPGLVWIALAGGVFEAGLGSIAAAHGASLGLTVAAATAIAGALGAGSFLVQYPAGWLADHGPPQRVFGAAGSVLLLGSLAFAASPTWPSLLWICSFAWGAAGGALYTLTMVRVAHEFAEDSAMAGVAAMITGYTAGAALGPLVSGLALDGFGAPGLAAWLALLASSILWIVARGHLAAPQRARGDR